MTRALGIDVGEARIGLAISDELGMLAHPLETIRVKEVKDPHGYIATIIEKQQVTAVIIGLPRNMDGSYGPAAAKVRAFAEKLSARIARPVQFWDERLTTVAAQRALHEAGRTARQSRGVIDQVAAQMILQGYLDSQSSHS
jgi:putative holliday junction resolvase